MANLGSLTITAGVKTRFTVPPTGIQAVVIGNESGLSCVISLEGIGVEKTLYPGTVDQFEVKAGFTGVVFVTPTIQIASAILYPSSFLTFDVIGIGETFNAASYPLVLARPMTAGTTSPQSGFSNEILVTTTAAGATNFGLNLFNPVGSGVIGRVFSMHIKITDIPGTSPKGIIGTVYTRVDGTNNGTQTGFSSADPAFSHNLGQTVGQNIAKIKSSQMLNAAVPTGNVAWEQYVINSDYYDFLGPPDAVYINEGQNLMFALGSFAFVATLVIGMKWTEA